MSNSRILFVNANTRFNHSSLAVPYMIATLKSFLPSVRTGFIETDVHGDPEETVHQILAFKPDVLAFSVYLWNIGYYAQVIDAVRKCSENIQIIAGGPEVSFAPERHSDLFDRILCGEGEIPLCRMLSGEDPGPHVYVPGSASGVEPFELEDLSILPSPFISRTYDLADRGFIFYESSRGCAWNCAYCASSNSRKVRNFPLERVFKDLDLILASGVRSIRFIDRTFNADDQRCCRIIEYILQRNTGKHFQFEIRPELISDELIDLLKHSSEGEIQFEIGLQSMNETVLKGINRMADLQKGIDRIRTLARQTPVHLHLDLIAGLPGETAESFFRSIDAAYCSGADSIQVGRLKVLPGTAIREHTDLVFSDFPPYRILATRDMGPGEIYHMDRLSRLVQLFYNDRKFSRTVPYLVSLNGSFSGFFNHFLRFWRDRALPWSGIGFKALAGHLYDYIAGLGLPDAAQATARELLQIDFHITSKDRFDFGTKNDPPSPAKHSGAGSGLPRKTIGPDSILRIAPGILYLRLSPATADCLGRNSEHLFIRASKKKNDISEILEFSDETELRLMVNIHDKIMTVRKNSEIIELNADKILEYVYNLYNMELIQI